MMVRWSGECQLNVKSQSELDIGGRETCFHCLALTEAQGVVMHVCPSVNSAQNCLEHS